jgi:putative tricarboxylic transport membrane protein
MLIHLAAALGVILQNGRLLAAVGLGALLGILGGATPGLSAPGALAVFLPFTFSMDALTGVSFLAAIYTGAQYGGSITATLFNTPGAPESAVMTLDGFALTRAGLARKALEAALWAGLVGGVFGLAALLAVLGPAVSLAVRFGPVEYASLAVLGFTAMSSVTVGPRAKALAATVFGILLGTVGLDPITAVPRYTFGLPALFGGLPLIPVLVGFFAISEGLMLIEKGGAHADLRSQRREGFGVREAAGHLPVMIAGGAVGTLVGVLPGGGASVASWIAYSVGRFVSREASRFGAGALDGLIAPEAADKAIVGGALVPLLTLGVPSTAGASVLIGGFELHNVVPGPDLLASQGPLVYGLLGTVLLANFAVWLWGRALIRPLLRVRAVAPAALGVGVLVLSLLGAYAYDSVLFSMALATAAGIAGYFLRKADVPVAPIILGLIIGPIFDQNFRRALINSNGSLSPFVTHPISLAMLAASAAFALLPLWLRRFAPHPRQEGA